jgi:crotonobetaine/carnitine-CoA ligase
VPSDSASFSPDVVFKACRAALEGNFVPSYLQVVDEIPKTASEKPQERFLIERFETDRDSVHTTGGN